MSDSVSTNSVRSLFAAVDETKMKSDNEPFRFKILFSNKMGFVQPALVEVVVVVVETPIAVALEHFV